MLLALTAGQLLGLLLDIEEMGWDLDIGFSQVPLPMFEWMVISWA